jgi:D-glycero-alpha-D-manno-heptose 1-phosphate guanylyltransferase
MTTAIVLAGGLGTRLRSVVPDLPKPMAPVAGRPFLEHLLAWWIGQGVDHVVLSVGYRREAIVEHFGDTWMGARIDYAVEEQPLGTGGALLLAAGVPRPQPGERVLLLNGDTWFDVDLKRLSSFAQASDADVCFSLFPATEPGRFMGMRVESDGRIRALRHDDQRVGRPANGGVYLVHPRVLVEAREHDGPISLEDALFPAWLDAGRRLYGMPCNGAFIDIGVPADFRRAAAVLAAVQPDMETLHHVHGA